MGGDEIDSSIGNLDHRVGRIEQILPTLVDKDDLRAAETKLHAAIAEAVAPLVTTAKLHTAIAEAVAPLATKAELRAAKAELHAAIAEAVRPLATKAELRETRAELHAVIAGAVEPLATKTELRDAITESEQRIRTHFDVMTESLRDDIQRIATGLATLSQRGH